MERYHKSLTALCLAAVLALPAGAAGSPYQDVTGTEWFAPAVTEITQRGIMQGTSSTAFSPYRAVDRATAITVLWRLEGSPSVATAGFSDTDGSWYSTAAAWAKAEHIASGYTDGSFGGADPITREQLSAFFYRYAIYKGDPLGKGALTPYPDRTAISPWAQEAVSHAVGIGLLKGDGDGRLSPQGTADRASLASMLQRMLTPASG